MSFTFNWPRFSDQFHYDAIQMLNNALNKGNKPPVIADKIEVVELEMGTQPPELEIRDIGDLTVDHFRGIFRLTYSGDAHLVLKTKVQANPLNHKQPDIHLMTGSSGMLAAKHPLVVPMLLRLSHFRLNAYVVLVVSKQKGITLVFKTDPLQNVDINSTFDSIAVIQNFIQREIEGQLRQMFREDLPGIIHRLSQQWVKAKVEAPYLSKRPPPPAVRQMFQTVSSSSSSVPGSVVGSMVGGAESSRPHLSRKPSTNSIGSRRARSTTGVPPDSTPSDLAGSSRTLSSSSSPDPQNEFDNFDPTYGLRPEGLPTKSGFKGFSSLFGRDKGLADLAEEEGSEFDDYEDEGTSYDVVEWEDTVRSFTPPQSVYNDKEPSPEYETIPAVGGGTITRPRVFHSQSAIQLHSATGSMSKSLSSLPTHRPGPARSGSTTPALLLPRLPHSASNPYFAGFAPGPSSRRASGSYRSTTSSTNPPFSAYTSARSGTPDSVDSRSQPSRSSTGPSGTSSTPHTSPDDDGLEGPSSRAPMYMRRPHYERRMSVTSTNTADMGFTASSSPPNHFSPLDHATAHHHHAHQQDPAKIVLRPTLNNSIHQLSTLSHSNHTLSPYTRDVSHFTVRSVPPRAQNGLGGPSTSLEYRQPVKAKRKRTYRLGGKKQQQQVDVSASAGPGVASGSQPFDEGEEDTESLFLHPLSVAADEEEGRFSPSSATGPRRGQPPPPLHIGSHPQHPSQRHRHHPHQQRVNEAEYARRSSTSPVPPPSELGFDLSDRDRYFRTMTSVDSTTSPNQTIRPRAMKKRPPFAMSPAGVPASVGLFGAGGLSGAGPRVPSAS